LIKTSTGLNLLLKTGTIRNILVYYLLQHFHISLNISKALLVFFISIMLIALLPVFMAIAGGWIFFFQSQFPVFPAWITMIAGIAIISFEALYYLAGAERRRKPSIQVRAY